MLLVAWSFSRSGILSGLTQGMENRPFFVRGRPSANLSIYLSIYIYIYIYICCFVARAFYQEVPEVRHRLDVGVHSILSGATVSSHDFNLNTFELRVSKPRTIVYFHFRMSFEISKLPGAGSIFPDQTFKNWPCTYPLYDELNVDSCQGSSTLLHHITDL